MAKESKISPDDMEKAFEKIVLIAEDDPVNQEVLQLILEQSPVNCRVHLVPDGREALEATSHHNFDLILMDCEMPRMDGFEATELIRKKEKAVKSRQEHPSAESSYTPIIALTGHSGEEIRHKCLAVGMNDVLSKPYDIVQVCKTLEHWLLQSPAPAGTSEEEGRDSRPSDEAKPHLHSGPHLQSIPLGETSAPPLDPRVLDNLRVLQEKGDPDVFCEIVELYLEYSTKDLEILHEAGSRGDTTTVQKKAHSLKGSSAHVGALRLSALFQDLETESCAKSLKNVVGLLSEIEREYQRVRGALSAELEKVSG